MRLSTRGRFAITALIDLALRDANEPVPLSEVAIRHKISLSYLEQVFAKLRQAGLVISIRGPGGGYTLGLMGDQISVADILLAIEDDTSASEKMGPAEVLTADLWKSMNSALLAHMRTISLHSLALEQYSKGFRVEARRVPVKKPPVLKPFPKVTTSAPNSVFAWSGVIPSRK
jgi:Rrf2 family iron-sulfur cluster assembly transcriptional regulator